MNDNHNVNIRSLSSIDFSGEAWRDPDMFYETETKGAELFPMHSKYEDMHFDHRNSLFLTNSQQHAESTTLMCYYFSYMLWEIDVCISLRQLPHGLSNSPRNKQKPKKRDEERVQACARCNLPQSVALIPFSFFFSKPMLTS